MGEGLESQVEEGLESQVEEGWESDGGGRESVEEVLYSWQGEGGSHAEAACSLMGWVLHVSPSGLAGSSEGIRPRC